jgi:putative N6-adenine-specific DNA methylase
VAEKNAKNAGVSKDIDFQTIDFASFEPKSNEGLLIINPPYGERMRERMVEPLYEMIGSQLKQKFSGFKAWVFSSSEEGFRKIGLRPSTRIPLYNGPLECSFRLFEVYEGSKKTKHQSEEQRREYHKNNSDIVGNRRPRTDFKSRNRDDFKPRDNKNFGQRNNNDRNRRDGGSFASRERSNRFDSDTENQSENRYEQKPREASEFTRTRDWSKFVPRHKLEDKNKREFDDKRSARSTDRRDRRPRN